MSSLPTDALRPPPAPRIAARLLAALPLALAGSAADRLAPPPAADFAYLSSPYPGQPLEFGTALALLDLNGDGHLDLAVGAPGNAGARGRVFVFWGPIAKGERLPAGPGSFLELEPPISAIGDELGASLAAGDLDGDGREELVIGAPGAGSGAERNGRVLVFRHDAGAPRSGHWRVLASGHPTLRLGDSVAVGDLLPGGQREVAAGAPHHGSQATPRVGAVHVFSKVLSDAPEELRLVNPSQRPGLFGHGLAVGKWSSAPGDHLAVSAVFNSVPWSAGNRLGQVLVYTDLAAPPVALDNPDPGSDPAAGSCSMQRFGMSLALRRHSGGAPMLAVGAPRKDGPEGECDAGRAFLFHGEAGRAERTSSAPGGTFGFLVLFADVDGSGEPEWLVGALDLDLVHVYGLASPGSPELLTTLRWRAPGYPNAPPSPRGGYRSAVAGNLHAASAAEEVAFGQPYFEDKTGRVVITFW